MSVGYGRSQMKVTCIASKNSRSTIDHHRLNGFPETFLVRDVVFAFQELAFTSVLRSEAKYRDDTNWQNSYFSVDHYT